MQTIGNIIIHLSMFLALCMALLWFLMLWKNKNKLYLPALKKNYPKVCIIVPCFNEEKTIVKTVRSLLKLDYPKNKLEIFIIDDGSTDKTYERAKTLLKHKQVKLFRKKNGGKHTALNYGLAKTKAEFVGCLDADSFVSPQSLKLIMSYFTDDNIAAVTPCLKVHQPKNVLQHIQKIEYIVGIFLRKIITLFDAILVTPGPFSIFRKKILDEVGPFRCGHNTEDMEMALRLQSKNYRIANALNAYVHTVTPLSFKPLYKQRKRWYQGLIKNTWDYKYIFINKKYGDLGLFILPMIFLTLFAFIITMFFISFQIIQEIIYRFTIWQAIGFDFSQTIFRLDWFFLNTQLIAFLGILLFGISIGIILLGKKMSYEKSNLTKGLLFFLLFYAPLYCIWWLGTIQAIIFNKKNKW